MSISVGELYDVTVLRMLPVGAVVRLVDGTTELIHISNISEKFVRDPANFLDVGQTYQAMGVAGKAHPVELSLKHLKLHPKYRNDLPASTSVDPVAESTSNAPKHPVTYVFDDSAADAAAYEKSKRAARLSNRNKYDH